MAGWLRKIGIGAAILGGTAVLVASLRAIQKSTAQDIRLSTRDGVLQPPLAGERPRAMAFAGDELFYVTNLESTPVTVRRAKRTDLGSMRVARSSTLATLNTLVRDYWSVPPLLRVSPGRVVVRFGERRSYDAAPCCTSELHVVERSTGSAWRTTAWPSLVTNEQVVAMPDGFVFVAERTGAIDVVRLVDRESKFLHDTELETALTRVVADREGPPQDSLLEGVAAMGDDVVVVARQPKPAETASGDFPVHHVLAASWRGGPARELATEQAARVVVLGGTPHGVWLYLEGSVDGARYVLVGNDGRTRARLPNAQGHDPGADATPLGVAGEDLLVASSAAGPGFELRTWSTSGSQRTVGHVRERPSPEQAVAVDAHDALLAVGDSLLRVTF